MAKEKNFAVCLETGIGEKYGREEVTGTSIFDPVLSENECKHCASTGKIPFSSHFKDDHRPLAEWLVAKIEQETAFAGPKAMKKIAPKLDL